MKTEIGGKEDAALSSSSSSSFSPSRSRASSDAQEPSRSTGSGCKKRKNSGRSHVSGHLLDSDLGITCHPCKKKVVTDHVLCRKCAIAFCGRCLRTRNGEDLDIEMKYVNWVCPKCRGGCGPGCSSWYDVALAIEFLLSAQILSRCESTSGSCNCAKCRKEHGLPLVKTSLADLRVSGFDNVHDYLIHLQTKESAVTIGARKLGRRWCRTHLEKPAVIEHLRSLIHYKANIPDNTVSSFSAKEIPKTRETDQALNQSNLKMAGLSGNIEALQNPSPSSSMLKDSTELHSKVSIPNAAECQTLDHYDRSSIRLPGMVQPVLSSTLTSRAYEITDSRNIFKRNLESLLSAPFDSVELKDKWQSIRSRKPTFMTLETRTETYDMPTQIPGRSYIDYYPDFAFKLTAATSPEEKLKLLRGFFFWLEHASTLGAFKPWTEEQKEDDECMVLDVPNCEEIYGVKDDHWINLVQHVLDKDKEDVNLDSKQLNSSGLSLKRVKQERDI